MNAYDKAALKVAEKMGLAKEGHVFDPTIIMTLVPIIMELILALQSCGKNTPEEGLSAMKHPNLWTRMIVRSKVRQTMSFREWWSNGNKLSNAILRAGQEATLEEVRELYNEDK